MQKLSSFLASLGLNSKEIKVYLALLELGEQPASVIGQRIKLPRSSTLFCLEHLVEKGFAVKRIHRTNISYFAPTNPQEIEELLNHKKQKIDFQVEKLYELMPEFSNIVHNFLPQSQIGYYDGIEGICRMIDTMTKVDTPMYFISAHDLHPEIRNYVRKVFVPRRRKMKSKCEMIVIKNSFINKHIAVAPNIYDWIGFINSKSALWKSITIVIYDNKVQFQSCNGESIGGILIENNYIATTMLALFHLLQESSAVEKRS